MPQGEVSAQTSSTGRNHRMRNRVGCQHSGQDVLRDEGRSQCLWVSMLRINRCGRIRSMSDVCCRAQVSKLPMKKPRLSLGRHCPIWPCCLSSIIKKKVKIFGIGSCSSAWTANLSYSIRPVTCLPISGMISMLCSQNGLSRSRCITIQSSRRPQAGAADFKRWTNR